MNWILGIMSWLFIASLLFYLCAAVNHFLYGDLLARQIVRRMKHPVSVIVILCLLVSANIVLGAVRAIEHRAAFEVKPEFLLVF